MNDQGYIGCALIGVAIALAVTWFTGCATAKPVGAEAAYLGEQLACVDKAATIMESRACRDAVKAAWAADAGGAR